MSSWRPTRPTLANDLVAIRPLVADDWTTLFGVASDPGVWEQHPAKDRYKREVFETFFREALASEGAFLVLDGRTQQVIGSSRFYGFDDRAKSIKIGYTFLARDHWGTGHNRALKTLMLDYAFQFVDKVVFEVGSVNRRSQKAVEKLGARKIGEETQAYAGETQRHLTFVYELAAETWQSQTR
jgi:RimJ/RimL family protein N-acetyltransferase